MVRAPFVSVSTLFGSFFQHCSGIIMANQSGLKFRGCANLINDSRFQKDVQIIVTISSWIEHFCAVPSVLFGCTRMQDRAYIMTSVDFVSFLGPFSYESRARPRVVAFYNCFILAFIPGEHAPLSKR